MYEAHFNLTRKPFASYPEPDMLYWGEGHKMARTMLVYGLNATSGIVVVTGEIGSGKTTLLNHVLNQDQSGHILGRLNGAIGLEDDIPAWMLYGFGMDSSGVSRTKSLSRLQEFLTQARAKKRKAVLFIDEAQLLSEATLEEIRLLSDMQVQGQPVLQLVLLGQPELAKILNQPILLQFRQRIVSHYHLKAFTKEDTVNYLKSRLKKANGSIDIFAKNTFEHIHDKTDGVPRRINILCDTALVYAFAQGDRQITREILDKVHSDRTDHGLLEIP